jgi:hypothetical protein
VGVGHIRYFDWNECSIGLAGGEWTDSRWSHLKKRYFA